MKIMNKNQINFTFYSVVTNNDRSQEVYIENYCMGVWKFWYSQADVLSLLIIIITTPVTFGCSVDLFLLTIFTGKMVYKFFSKKGHCIHSSTK